MYSVMVKVTCSLFLQSAFCEPCTKVVLCLPPPLSVFITPRLICLIESGRSYLLISSHFAAFIQEACHDIHFSPIGLRCILYDLRHNKSAPLVPCDVPLH